MYRPLGRAPRIPRFARYPIKPGQNLASLSKRVRDGRRVDTCKDTWHCLRPVPEAVTAYLAAVDRGEGRQRAALVALLLRQQGDPERTCLAGDPVDSR